MKMSVIKSGHKSRAKAEASRRIAARFTPPGIQSHPLPGVNMGLSMPNLVASSPALMPEGYAAVTANPSQVTMSLVPASRSIGRSFNPFDAAPSPVGLISFDPTRDAEPQIHLYDGMVEWQKASKPKATKKKTPRGAKQKPKIAVAGLTAPSRSAPQLGKAASQPEIKLRNQRFTQPQWKGTGTNSPWKEINYPPLV